MPSGNTNIMKEYKERFESLKEFRYETCKQDFDKYLNKCNDILYLDDYWDWIKDEISKCENYIHDLKIVLKVNQLKDER